MLSKDLLQMFEDAAPHAIRTLERHGYGIIYAGENEQTRRKELRAQGVTKIRMVPWSRPEPESKHE